MEQATEKKIIDLSRLLARLLGIALYAVQVILALLFLLGVGGAFAGEISVDTVVDQAMAILEIDFNVSFGLIVDVVLKEFVNIIFIVAYVIMLVSAIVNAVNSLTSLKKAALGSEKAENWAGVGALKNAVGKNIARITTFSVMSSLVVSAPLNDHALIGICGGLAVWAIAYVCKVLFENEKTPCMGYYIAELGKLALRAFILLSFIGIFAGTYIADIVDNISFLVCTIVSGGMELTSPLFGKYLYQFASSFFMMVLVMSWLDLIKKYLTGKNQSANGAWKKYLSAVIVFIVIDFLAQAFLLGTYGNAAFTEKFMTWVQGNTFTGYLPIVCLATAGVLLAAFPPIKKYSEIVKKTESKKATIIPVRGNKNAVSKNVSKTADDAADELLKYKEMLDEGIITESDYEKKKKQILGL